MNIPGTKILYFSPLIHRYLVTAMILYYGSTRMPKSARMSNLMSVSVMVLLMVILVVFPKEVLIMSLPGANNPTAVRICWMLLQICRSSCLIFTTVCPQYKILMTGTVGLGVERPQIGPIET
jgi:hypothetical protein